jgi:hypothetical protein
MMKKLKRIVQSYFQGTMFQLEEVRKQGPLFFVLFCWTIIMIYVSGSADHKIYTIKRLDDQRRQLKSEHVNYRAKLMDKTKPTIVQKEVEQLGLEYSFKPPIHVKGD